MKYRLKRLFKGQTCPVCNTKRRVKWFFDTGVCSQWCLQAGLFFNDLRRRG